MINKAQLKTGQATARDLIKKSGLLVTEAEFAEMEVADFGLNNYPTEGAQIITFLNTEKVGYKAICLAKRQSLPEHWHTASLGEEGKEESFRVVYGNLRLFVPDDHKIEWPNIKTWTPKELPCPAGKQQFYTCNKELKLAQAEQVTLPPGVPHWFMADEGGCVVLSISSWARCALDPFTDPNVIRETVYE